MLGVAARRLLAAVVTVAMVVTLTFALVHLAPGEPMIGDAERQRADHGMLERQRASFGLDRPLHEQYLRYVANAARGDLGHSFSSHRSVGGLLMERLPNTVLLAGASLVLAFGLGIIVALVQARRAGTWADGALGATVLTFYSTPSFWLGLVLLLVFGQLLGWLPAGGMTTPVLHDRLGAAGRAVDVAKHLLLPAVTLALVQTAAIARFQRGALLDAVGSDFVRAARARGLGDRAVLVRHALRSALAPVVTLAGTSVPALLAGSVLVESVFSWPGLGRLTYDAIQQRDYNVITAAALLAGTLVALGNLAADLAVAALDPRTRR